MDDKGVTLVAALGLPPLAHEDDAVRGVQAALAIQAVLGELGLHSAIGVTTGRAFCGSVGSTTRREYTMIGDVVNLSARLMQAAGAPPFIPPNGGERGEDILCDEATYQAAQSRLAFKALPPIRVKGKAEALAVYRPRSEATTVRASKRSQGMMVGRDSEREALATQLESLEAGNSGMVIIEGEAGIGKSRLVAELRGQATGLAVQSMLGWADAIEKRTPYHAWRPLFAQLFDLDLLTDIETQRERVQTYLQDEPDLLSLLPLMNAVLPLDLPDNDLTGQMKGEGRANKTNDLLIRVLQKKVAHEPLLLILEDAHWMDSASWALARLVSLDVQPLLLVIATRPMPEPLPKEYSQFLEKPKCLHLALENLPPAAIQELVCNRLGVAELPAAVATLIHECAEGHPFFSEELAYALRDAGLIVVQDGTCRIAPQAGDLSAIHFPDTVQGVVASRIDRLTPQQQLALKVASVIGRVFALHILHDVHPIAADKPRLPDYLDGLERLDITPLETPPPDLSYIFKHIITQEVAYNLMLFAQRQQLHRAVAEWYEQAHAGDLSPYYALLAHHWGKADATAKAIDYLAQAGEQAIRGGAYQEAVGFLEQALALDAQLEPERASPDRAHWEYQLGEAYYGLGRMTESREHLARALTLLGYPPPTSTSSLVLNILGQFIRQVWHRLRPDRIARPAKAGSDGAGGSADQLLIATRACERLGQVYYLRNEKIPFIHYSLQGLNIAEQLGVMARAEQARFYGTVALAAVPQRGLAEMYAQLADMTVQHTQDHDASAWVALVLGIHALSRARFDQARAHFDHCIQHAEQIGHVRRWEEGTGSLLVAFICQGDWDIAAPLYTALYITAVRQGDAQAQGWALTHQAYIALRRGQFAPALRLAQQCEGIHEHTQEFAGNINNLGVLILGHMRKGAMQPARHYAERAITLLAQSPPTTFYMLYGYIGVAEFYLTLWETQPTAEHRKLAQAACKHLQRFARIFGFGKPIAWAYQGWYEWLAGNPRKARKSGEKAIQMAQQFDMPYDKALGHYHLGRFLPASDATTLAARREHFAQAVAIFERLGAAWDLERAREALGEANPVDKNPGTD